MVVTTIYLYIDDRSNKYKYARTAQLQLASQLGCKGPLPLRGVEERQQSDVDSATRIDTVIVVMSGDEI